MSLQMTRRGASAREQISLDEGGGSPLVMLGFNQFRHAALSSAEIELMQRIRKGSSGCDVSAFEVELRPQCGMQCSGHEGARCARDARARAAILHRTDDLTDKRVFGLIQNLSLPGVPARSA